VKPVAASRSATPTPQPAVAAQPVTAAATPVTAAAPPPAAMPKATAAPAVTKVAEATKKVPKTHNDDHEGVMHAPGSDNPVQKCGACHGKDLRGGKVSKSSCFECHEKVW
jgi:hypothetical protein